MWMRAREGSGASTDLCVGPQPRSCTVAQTRSARPLFTSLRVRHRTIFFFSAWKHPVIYSGGIREGWRVHMAEMRAGPGDKSAPVGFSHTDPAASAGATPSLEAPHCRLPSAAAVLGQRPSSGALTQDRAIPWGATWHRTQTHRCDVGTCTCVDALHKLT